MRQPSGVPESKKAFNPGVEMGFLSFQVAGATVGLH